MSNHFDLTIEDGKLKDICYRTEPPEETISPQIFYRQGVPCVHNKRDGDIPLEDFLALLANNSKKLYVVGNRISGSRTTITFSKKDRVGFSPELKKILDSLRTDIETKLKLADIATESFEVENTDKTLVSNINSSSVVSVISHFEQKKFDSETKSLNTDEREAIVKARYGQGSFRDALINIAGDNCWMSGIEGERLLIASHIKPWSHCESDKESRGNSNNGLLLSALWDSAFDSGLISFDEDWKVICSAELSESARKALNISQHNCLRKDFRNKNRAEFMEYHRNHVFQN